MKTLVIGASTNPERYAYKAIEKLKSKAHEVVALGRRTGEVAGVSIQTEKRLFAEVDTVSLYLSPDRQINYYDYIIALNPRRVLFNPGTENQAFEARLKQHQIDAQRACTLVLLATNQY
ncbi:MAG: CoA-binding protein [Flavobacteriaceae bacterium]